MHVFDNPEDEPAEFPAHVHGEVDEDGFAVRNSHPDDFLDLPQPEEEG